MNENGFQSSKMVFVYVDDIMCISHFPQAVMNAIQTVSWRTSEMKVINAMKCWTMFSDTNMESAIVQVDETLTEGDIMNDNVVLIGYLLDVL